MIKNIVQIRYNNVRSSTFLNRTVMNIGDPYKYIFKSEIEYIKDKPYWKGKEIYEIIENG